MSRASETFRKKEQTMSAIFEHGHALLVGVGGLDLPTTVDDAKALAEIFRDPGRCAYLPANVSELTGNMAARADILSSLDALAKKTTHKSTIVVYFSGHGYRVQSSMGEEYFLMPNGYNTSALYKTAISGTEFMKRLKAIPAQRLLVLLDCCHAGGVGDAKEAGLQLTKAALPLDADTVFAKGSGRVVIASSQSNELSFAGKPYSAFTLALIEALCGKGAAKKDGYVRWTDLALYTREQVPQRTMQRQHPIIDLQSADNFAIAHYAGGDIEPKAMPYKGAPEIEPEPGAFSGVILGSQYNIGRVRMSGGFFQPGMTVTGSLNQAEGDINVRTVGKNYYEPNGGAALDITSNSSRDDMLKLVDALTASLKGLIMSSKDKRKAKHALKVARIEIESEQADRAKVASYLKQTATVVKQATSLSLESTEFGKLIGQGLIWAKRI
jgi:hypothetical protein